MVEQMLPSTQIFHQKLFVIYDFINKAKGNCTCTRQEASNSHLVSAHELLFCLIRKIELTL